VEHADAGDLRIGETGCVFAAGNALAAGLDANQLDILVVAEGVEDAQGVTAATNTGDDDVRQPAGNLLDLLPCLAADDALKIAHQDRIRMRP
jgi:hypothetical protein